MSQSREIHSAEVLLKSFAEKKPESTFKSIKFSETDINEASFLSNMNKALGVFSKEQKGKSESSGKVQDNPLQKLNDDFRRFSYKLLKLEEEKQHLEEKLKLYRETSADQDISQQKYEPYQLQEIIRRYDQFEEHLKKIEDKNNEILIYKFYPFIKPYLDRHPDLPVEKVLEKVPLKEKKKLVAEVWENHQEELKNLVAEKYSLLLENHHLIYSVSKLNDEDFGLFSRHSVEHDIITRFINVNESLTKFKEILQNNNTQETSI